MNNNEKLNKLVKISLLAAIATILMLIELPMTAYEWLKIDLSEVPVLMGAFAFGPIAGIVIEALKVGLNFLINGTITGGVGELANFLMGVALIIPASFIYHRNKTKKTAIIGMVVGTIVINLVAILANTYLLLPAYGMKMTGSALNSYILFGLIPINTIKGILSSVVTYVLYKRLSLTLFKVDHEFGKKNKQVV